MDNTTAPRAFRIRGYTNGLMNALPVSERFPTPHLQGAVAFEVEAVRMDAHDEAVVRAETAEAKLEHRDRHIRDMQVYRESLLSDLGRAEDMLARAVALIEGDAVGAKWKRQCNEFVREARDLLGMDTLPGEDRPDEGHPDEQTQPGELQRLTLDEWAMRDLEMRQELTALRKRVAAGNQMRRALDGAIDIQRAIDAWDRMAGED